MSILTITLMLNRIILFNTAQKGKFSVMNFFSKCEQSLNRKAYLLCSAMYVLAFQTLSGKSRYYIILQQQYCIPIATNGYRNKLSTAKKKILVLDLVQRILLECFFFRPPLDGFNRYSPQIKHSKK